MRGRAEDGFTLVEVLVAATLGFVILAASLGLLESTLRLTSGVVARTDAMQRGRVAMDIVTQQLRSQVCLDYRTPAILEGSDDDSVTFYADFSQGDASPVRRTLAFDPASGILQTVVRSTTAWPAVPTPASYTETPRANRVLERVDRAPDPANPGARLPYLRYFAYEDAAPGVTSRRPIRRLDPPLDAAEAARVARIEVAFLARPTDAAGDDTAVALTGQVGVRHADPNLTVPDPACT